MNRKQLILLLIFLAVIGAAGLILLKYHKDTWSSPQGKMGEKLLPDFDPNNVAGIHISGAGELHVSRKDGTWRVQERADYPANFHQISDQLLKLKELKIVQSDTIGPSQLGRVNLEQPGKGPESGTLVEFLDAQGKVIDSMLLGKTHLREQGEWSADPLATGRADGRYLLLPNDPQNVLLVSNTLAGFTPNPAGWLDHDFFQAVHIQSVEVTPPNSAPSWKVLRESETAPWMFNDMKPGENLNQGRLAVEIDKLGSPRFNDVVLNASPAETGLANPTIVKIKTFDHFIYTLKIGATAPPDGRYITIEVAAQLPSPALEGKLKREQTLARWVYTVNGWTVEGWLAGRANLLGAPPASSDNSSAAPASHPPASTAPANLAPLMIQKQ